MRYLLFGGEIYYAQGGMNDYLGGAESLDNLKDSEVLKNWGRQDGLDWWHIYDTQESCFVAGTTQQAHAAPDLNFKDKV